MEPENTQGLGYGSIIADRSVEEIRNGFAKLDKETLHQADINQDNRINRREFQ